MLISEVTAFLENAFVVLNEHYFESSLPQVRITVQSSKKSMGHYTTINTWYEQSGEGYKEINIAAEILTIPIEELISVLMHEMVHHYCDCNGIKDTSRGNIWHNKRFKIEAEKRGLLISYNDRIGYSITKPAPCLTQFVYDMGWNTIDLARVTFGSTGSSGSGCEDGTNHKKKKNHIRKYQCPICGCSVRASKEVSIACLDCNTKMLLATLP